MVINSWQIKKENPHKTRLLQKASKTFLLTAVVLMTLSAAILYFYTVFLLTDETQEELYSNKDQVEQLLMQDSDLKGIPPIILIEIVANPEVETLKDTLMNDPLQDEIELFRQLSGTKEINGQLFKVTVRSMVVDSEDIAFAIVFTFMVVTFLAFIFLFYMNKSRNKKLWAPFFVSLDKLKNFSIKSDFPLELDTSEIIEFDDLNREIFILTTKLQTDYRNLKQFTEDVSHEIQTPLAIMQAKIDTVINDAAINDAQFEHFSSLQIDIQRLKQLNKKLILLTKIDNNQFTANEMVSMNEIAQETISNFQELTPIEIQYNSHKNINVHMDRSLAAILFNNLLSNAVKHNKGNTPVVISIAQNNIQVQNTGTKSLEHPEQIFERFYKESVKPDSTGLGLSIVKKICDYYGFSPSYSFMKDRHIFQINFNKK